MINSDHQSPIASSDRAIGHSSFSKLVRFTRVSFRQYPRHGDHCLVWLHYETRCPRWQLSLMMQPVETVMRLKNKTALISGGNSGIGLETARVFVAEGARVIITGRNKDTLAKAEKELGPNVFAAAADITDIAATEAAIK